MLSRALPRWLKAVQVRKLKLMKLKLDHEAIVPLSDAQEDIEQNWKNEDEKILDYGNGRFDSNF